MLRYVPARQQCTHDKLFCNKMRDIGIQSLKNVVLMNKQALVISVVIIAVLVASVSGCTTTMTDSNSTRNSSTQKTTLISSAPTTVGPTAYPPDNATLYAYGKVYFSDYYGTHDKTVEMFALSQYPTCHLCKYKSAEVTLYQSSASPDVWIAPYLVYYSKTDVPPYYQKIGQDTAAYSLLGDQPIVYGDLGWVHMTHGDVKYVNTQNFVPNSAHWIGYGALIYVDGHIQQLYPNTQYVIWY